MTQKPFYSFSTSTETGLNNIPVNSLIQLEYPTDGPQYLILLTEITNATLSIDDFVNNNINDYANLTAGHIHEYDTLTHTLRILMPLPKITDFNASDTETNKIVVSCTFNGAERFDLYDGGTLLEQDINYTVVNNTLSYDYPVPTSTTPFPNMKFKAIFRQQELFSNEDSGVALDDPTPIIDLTATDGLGQVTLTWTDSIGFPAVVQTLWTGPLGSRVQIATNVSSPYVDNYVGTRNYFIVADNGVGPALDSNEVIGTGNEVPGTITDFSATDTITDQIQMTFTPTTGWPAPTYNLYDQNGIIQYNITSGYMYTYIGTKNFYVQAVNDVALHPNGVNSNVDAGTGLDTLELDLPSPTSSGTINLRSFIDANNTVLISTYGNPAVQAAHTRIKVSNAFTQPKIITGDLTGLDVTFVNNGEVQGNTYSGTGFEATSPIKLINNGWIRGAGGKGGQGGHGGKGANSSTSSQAWVNLSYSPNVTDWRWQVIGGQTTHQATIIDLNGAGVYINHNGFYNGPFTVTEGTFRKGAHVSGAYPNTQYFVLQQLQTTGTNYTGGQGGQGGFGGNPRTYSTTNAAGSPGQNGFSSSPSGGNSGGKGGQGGSGGNWAQNGATGQTGQTGHGGGYAGSGGLSGQIGGRAIIGNSNLTTGSVTGNVTGIVS